MQLDTFAFRANTSGECEVEWDYVSQQNLQLDCQQSIKEAFPVNRQ